MSVDRACLVHLSRRTALVALLVIVVSIEGQAQLPAISRNDAQTYDDLLKLYRSGAIERSVGVLDELLARADGQREAHRWIGEALRANRRDDLEAAFLLYSEAIMAAWRQDDPYPAPRVERYTTLFQRLRVTLARMNPKSPFLRIWYLLWESFRHGHINRPLPNELDFLDEALNAFPIDAQILLAAGSRQELNWWMSLENSQRDLGPQPLPITRLLIAARDFLRRSLSANPGESEARLRLAHVLLELNDLKAVPEVLSTHDWAPDGPAFEYLARLFEGDLHERSGDRKAAAASYDRAITLASVPQSALVARAHLAHLDGRRAESARLVTQALSIGSVESDPWWPFTRGQAWRFESYLKAARALAMVGEKK